MAEADVAEADVAESDVAGSNRLGADRWRAIYLAALGVAVGVVAAIGVLARGDGSTEAAVSARGERFDMVVTGVYANNPERLVAEGIGWDVVTLVLAVPALMITARAVARGSLRARLIAIGLLAYLFYQYLMYAMAWAVGPMLPAFIVLYAASLMGIGWFVASVPIAELHESVRDTFPRRATATFCVAISLLLVGMWVPMIAGVLAGGLDGTLIGQTTLVVQALDLGIVVPLALLTAVLLWRRHPAGDLLASVVVVKGLAMATAICAMVLSAWFVEGRLDAGALAIFVVVAAVSLALLVAILRAVGASATSHALTSRATTSVTAE